MTEGIARTLFIIGAVCAVVGPLITVVRTAVKYRKAKDVKPTYSAVGAMVTPAVVVPAARRDAWWSVAEFALVGLGVALTAVASLILIPA
jgi:hypothetical protein